MNVSEIDEEVSTPQLTTSHTIKKNITPSHAHTTKSTTLSHSYASDFEDNTVPTSNMGYSADVTVKDSRKENIEVAEDISSEGDTLVEQQQLNNSQLDDTLQDSKLLCVCVHACVYSLSASA